MTTACPEAGKLNCEKKKNVNFMLLRVAARFRRGGRVGSYVVR